MNEVNDVSANWEVLLDEVGEDRDMEDVDLSDSKADLFDLSNELRMRPLRERLLEAFQNRTYPDRYCSARLGNKFFVTMNERQQWSFLRRIMALPVGYLIFGEGADDGAEKPAITIHTSALLDALADLSPHVWWLYVGNFALSNHFDVEALSNIIFAKRRNHLGVLILEDIECPPDYNKRDDDGPVGFLDPLLFAVSRLKHFKSFGLSARTPPSHSSLVSPEAARALFGKARGLNFLVLNGLGLNDSHCHAIADECRASGVHVARLNLRSNPAISAQGYGALLGLMNLANAVKTFLVDDETWEGKLNFVSEMNACHGRLEYMTDGAFSSEECRWQWLKKLATLPSSSDEEDAKQINFIWCELLEHPEFMQT